MNGHHGNGNEIKCKMLIEGPDDDDDIFSRTSSVLDSPPLAVQPLDESCTCEDVAAYGCPWEDYSRSASEISENSVMNGDSSLIKSASVFSSPNREGCSKIATSTRVNVLRIPLAFQREVDEDSEKIVYRPIIMGAGLFAGKKAWFSTSVPSEVSRGFAAKGGVRVEDPLAADYLIGDDAFVEDTQRIFASGSTLSPKVVIRSDWIRACGEAGDLVQPDSYLLPPPPPGKFFRAAAQQPSQPSSKRKSQQRQPSKEPKIIPTETAGKRTQPEAPSSPIVSSQMPSRRGPPEPASSDSERAAVGRVVPAKKTDAAKDAGAVFEQNVVQLVSMGYSASQAEQALRRARGDTVAAVQWLANVRQTRAAIKANGEASPLPPRAGRRKAGPARATEKAAVTVRKGRRAATAPPAGRGDVEEQSGYESDHGETREEHPPSLSSQLQPLSVPLPAARVASQGDTGYESDVGTQSEVVQRRSRGRKAQRAVTAAATDDASQELVRPRGGLRSKSGERDKTAQPAGTAATAARHKRRSVEVEAAEPLAKRTLRSARARSPSPSVPMPHFDDDEQEHADHKDAEPAARPESSRKRRVEASEATPKGKRLATAEAQPDEVVTPSRLQQRLESAVAPLSGGPVGTRQHPAPIRVLLPFLAPNTFSTFDPALPRFRIVKTAPADGGAGVTA